MITLTTAVDLILDNGGRNEVTDIIEEHNNSDDWDETTIIELSKILNDSLEIYRDVFENGDDDGGDEALFEGWRAVSVSLCDLLTERVESLCGDLLDREEIGFF